MFVDFVDSIDAFLLEHLNFVNFEEDKLKLMIYFLLCVPLGFVFREIRSQSMRLWYNLILGQFFTLCLGKGWFVFINLITITIYAISKIPKPVLPVSIFAFAALSYVHIYRLLFDYLSWKMDFNVIQMMATCRYIYYAVDLQDGNSKDRSFLSYYSYIFMFPNLIIGPVPFKEFMNLINQVENQSMYKHSDALKQVGFAIVLATGEIFIRPHFDFDWYTDPRWAEMNIVLKYGLQTIIAIVTRFRYFMAFKFTQAGMDACGITYNTDTGKCDKFRTFTYEYEIEKSSLNLTSQWNSLVQQWLKYCFHQRLYKTYKHTFYIVYAISALWYYKYQTRHGFYLSYYLFFLQWALVNQNCKYFYKAQRKFYFLPQSVRHFLAWVYVHVISINFGGIGVALLSWEKNIQLFNSVYWTPQLITVGIFLFFFVTEYGQKQKKQ